MTKSIETRLSTLEEKVAALESNPLRGRQAIPILVSEEHVCGVTGKPSGVDGECPHATVYRHQQGCRGDACVEINRAYYKDYREKRAAAKEKS